MSGDLDQLSIRGPVDEEVRPQDDLFGHVNNHWLRKFGFILASSAIDIGTAALGSRRGGGNQLVIGGTVAENARSPLDEFAKRQLDIPPTIEVEPKEISVMLSQHLPLDCFDQR